MSDFFPGDFLFLRPLWLLALPLVVAAAWLLAHRQLRRRRWEGIVDAGLQPHVLATASSSRRDSRWWLAGICGALAVVALAGPAWERVELPVFRDDQALVIALDLSRSMDAQDVAPSRLLRSRLKILDMLSRRAGGETALIVYSGNAFTVTPLTTDADTIASLVGSLTTDIMPSRGSYPEAAIAKGRALLEQAGAQLGEVLLIADGGVSPAAERAARDLRAAGYTLSVLGVGTPDGAPIPMPGGGFVTDQTGRMAVPQLEEDPLRRLAAAGGGRYARLSATNSDLEHLLSGKVGQRRLDDDSLATDQWQEAGVWLLLVLLPLAAMGFRRGWIMVLAACAIVPLSTPASAADWDDLWRTPDQQGQAALEEGDPATAAALFADREWQAVARYRNGEFAASAAAFAESGDARSLYNLGNALARQGEFESAIDAYDEVLEMDPGDEDAAYNRDLLRQLLEQQQQQQGQQQEQESGDSQASQDPAGDSESDADGEPREGEQQAGDPGDADDREPGEEDMRALQEELQRAAEEAEREESLQQLSEAELAALREEQEQEQAMEQWLRRIADDPGGLLRRKFRYQYRAQGRDQDGNATWPDDEVHPW